MSLEHVKVGDDVIFYRWGTSRPMMAKVSKVGRKFLQIEGWDHVRFYRDTGKVEHYSDWYIVTIEQDREARASALMRRALRDKGIELVTPAASALTMKVYEALAPIFDLPKIEP